MGARQRTSPPAGRVVVLSNDPSLRAELARPGLDLTATPTAYQAAAEIIAEKPLVLVIDLKALSKNDLKLLDLAKTLGCPLAGVGDAPRWLDAQGLRMFARAQASQALAEFAQAPEPTPEPAPAEQPAQQAEQAGEPEPEQEFAVSPPPARPPQGGYQPQGDPSPPEPIERINPSTLLTADELSALLENEP